MKIWHVWVQIDIKIKGEEGVAIKNNSRAPFPGHGILVVFKGSLWGCEDICG